MNGADEYQISMAGGDGDPTPAELLATYREASLLETVRTQQATIDRVLNLANSSGRCGWRISADELRKTLRGES